MDQKIPIVDCHCHLTNKRLYDEYKEKSYATKIISIRPIKILSNDMEVSTSENWFYELLKEKDDLYGVECIEYGEDIKAQLQRISGRMENCKKIIGIKLYVGYQHFYANDPEIFDVYKFAKKNNLVVVFHGGDVWDPSNQAQIKYTHPSYVDEVATYFPKVKFVISHFAFPYILETGMVVHKNQNVYTDISGILDNGLTSKYFVDDIKKVLSYYPEIINKIMHGSDFCGNQTPLNNTIEYQLFVRNNFTDEEAELIFHKNAEKLYGI